MPDNSATIIGGVILIDKVAGYQVNVAELDMFVLSVALEERRMCQIIAVVFDIDLHQEQQNA